MENDPFDKALGDMLADYSAPIADNGFTEAVIAHTQKEARLRRWLILGACFAGGLIASTQISKLSQLSKVFGGFTPTVPNLDLDVPTALSTGYLVPAMTLFGAGLMIWLAREVLDSHI